MTVLMALLLLFVVVSFYLFFNPLTLSLNLSYRDSGKGMVYLKFAPFKFKFQLGKTRKKSSRMRRLRKLKTPGKKLTFRKKQRIYRTAFAGHRDVLFKVLGACLKFMLGLLQSFRRFRLAIRLKGGLSTPDLTGQAYGAVCACQPLLGKTVTVSFDPDFNSRTVSGDISGSIETKLGGILKEMLLFAGELPKLELIKLAWKLKKTRRQYAE